MINDLLADTTYTALAKALDGLAERHRAITSNIANVETPGYKRAQVSFENELREALKERDEAHARSAIKRVKPELSRDYTSPERADGNNVSIDQEATALIKNNLSYQTTASILTQKILALRQVISEGKQ
jgi:flagellar basal-body rod protein FlgB